MLKNNLWELFTLRLESMSVSIMLPKLSFQYCLYGALSATTQGITTVEPIICVMIGLHFTILVLPLEH